MTDRLMILAHCNMTWTPGLAPGAVRETPPCPTNNGPHICYRHVGDIHFCSCGQSMRSPLLGSD